MLFGVHVMQSRYAVLLADVIASGRQRRLQNILGEKLRAASQVHMKNGWIRAPYAVTAGDEFQTVATRPAMAPEILLDLRHRMRPLQLRMAIGVGAIDGAVRAPVNRMQGEAFVRARRAMDALKSGMLHKYPALTAFHTGQTSLDEIANLIYGLSDTLLRAVTAKQWRAMEAYFAKGQVRLAARALRLDPSTVSRRLSRGHYWQLAETAEAMKRLLQSEFH